MTRWIRFTLFVGTAILAGIQVVRPPRTTAHGDPVDGIPGLRAEHPDVAAILTRSCSDCHSEQTRWPWYSNVAPVSWFVANDVREARGHFNMSRFAMNTTERQREKLREICDEVSEGEMPLRSYLWVHREARLSSSDIATLCSWTRTASAATLRDETRRTRTTPMPATDGGSATKP